MLNKIFKLDWILITAIVLLASVGLLVIYSLSIKGSDFSSNIFLKQAVFFAIGMGAMFFLAFVDYNYWRSYSRMIYFIAIFTLLWVLFFGVTVRGTSGWISFGIFNIQPVEFSKLALVVFIAAFISKKKTEINETGRLFVSLILSGIMVLFVMKQPDFGSAAVLMGIWLGMIIISSVNKKIFFILFFIGAMLLSAGWFLLAGFQKERITNFFNPELNAKGSGYNLAQSLIAIGSGGITGKGIGHGSQSQLNFLPEKHTDFIFAVVTEELGLFGAFFVLFLYGVIFYRLKKIAGYTVDNFGFLVVCGMMIYLFMQVAVNIGMNIGIIPVAGITLPFLSYGGSSLISFFIGMGMVLNISQKRAMLSDKTVYSD